MVVMYHFGQNAGKRKRKRRINMYNRHVSFDFQEKIPFANRNQPKNVQTHTTNCAESRTESFLVRCTK